MNDTPAQEDDRAASMKTVMVIGSNSFSGGDFIDFVLEERDYRVIGVSRSAQKDDLFLAYRLRPGLDERFTFHQLDLNHDMEKLFALLDQEQPDFIVNFAAQSEVAPSWEHPEQWFMTNAVAIARLGDYLKDKPWLKRYVHISSPEVYGSCEGTVTEDHCPNPSTPYAASKAAGDMMLSTLVKNFDFPLITIRATNVYGPRQQLFKIIPRSAIYIKLGQIIQLHGGGHAVKSYIHIRDVSRGELAAMEQGEPGEIYHLSPDQGIPVCDAVGAICNAMGRDPDCCTEVVAERLGQDKAYVIDSTKAREQFDWQPTIDLQTGVEQVIEWVNAYWPRIKEEPLQYIHKA